MEAVTIFNILKILQDPVWFDVVKVQLTYTVEGVMTYVCTFIWFILSFLLPFGETHLKSKEFKTKRKSRLTHRAIRIGRGGLVMCHCCVWQRESPVVTAYFSQQNQQPRHTALTYGGQFAARLFFTLSQTQCEYLRPKIVRPFGLSDTNTCSRLSSRTSTILNVLPWWGWIHRLF